MMRAAASKSVVRFALAALLLFVGTTPLRSQDAPVRQAADRGAKVPADLSIDQWKQIAGRFGPARRGSFQQARDIGRLVHVVAVGSRGSRLHVLVRSHE